MIRFRFTEDERRYLHLLSESYRILATRMPAPLVSRVMRNFGKLEQMAALEGVRQGLAISEVSLLNEERGAQSVRGLRAFQAHAVIYGSTDTPLRNVELEWLETITLPPSTAASAWLDDKPLRFAPQTLDEWEGENDPLPELGNTPHFAPLDKLNPELRSHFETTTQELPVNDDPDLPPGIKPEGADSTQERPAMLDQIRDVLRNANPKPTTWKELILCVHRATNIDAGFLDIQLSTDMGRTVLAQCNIHIDPGLGINLQDLDISAKTPQPGTEEQETSASEDDGADPDGN